jgi:hypothetical protein
VYKNIQPERRHKKCLTAKNALFSLEIGDILFSSGSKEEEWFPLLEFFVLSKFYTADRHNQKKNVYLTIK